eukprot:759828-Hanusia_phi.AAC.2
MAPKLAGPLTGRLEPVTGHSVVLRGMVYCQAPRARPGVHHLKPVTGRSGAGPSFIVRYLAKVGFK